MRLLVQSETFTLRLRKPTASDSGQRIQILLQMAGEHALRVRYGMRASHTSAIGGASGDAKEWELLGNRSYSFYGLHITWGRPPSADAELDLDGNANRFTAAKASVAEFAVDCYGAQPCPQDGDSFATELSVAARSDPTDLRSVVTVTTVVESLLSCEHSTVQVEGDVVVSGAVRTVPQSGLFRILLQAFDVDELPINQTRQEVSFYFGGHALRFKWTRGSNKYIANVLPELTRNEGDFIVVVDAIDAWPTRCELSRLTVRIAAREKTIATQYIILGAVLGAVILALGSLLAYQIRAHQERAKRFLESFLKHEGQLTPKICWDCWVRSSLRTPPV